MEGSFYQNPNINDEPINQKNLINLSNYFDILIRRKKIFSLISIIFIFIATSNLLYKRIKNPIYQGSFTLMISDPFITNRTADNRLADLALNRETLDIPTLVQYLKSPGMVSNIAKDNNISPINLINSIKITVPSNDGDLGRYLSKTLLISIEGQDKNKMRKILKELSQHYIVKASDSRNEKLSDGINFLNSEKPKLLFKVKQAQNKLENFRLENKIIDPIQEGDAITSSIEENKNKIITIESENVRLIFIKENLVNGILYTEGLSSSRSSSNATGLGIIGSDQLLLQEILQVKSQLANAQSKYKKSSSVIKNLEEKLNQLEPILLKNQKSAVDAAIIVNNSLIKSYQNQINELQKKFISIPKKVTQYSTTIQDLNGLEKNLQSLNETKDKLELDLSQGTLPWKIIKEPLVNPTPIKPEIKRSLIFIMFYTLGISSLITFLIERLDDVFHNAKEIETLVNLPILGFVPFFNFRKDVVEAQNEANTKNFITVGNLLENQKTYKNLNFIFEETFRNIYTSIKFSKSDKQIKIINLTSTIPEEGKSLCSLFLGINISQIQKKVLIIDTDLRRPSLHKRLEVDNVLGISNYLVSNENDWRKYITNNKNFKNLSYMTAGKIPPNSISLLESNKMKLFIDELRESSEYDFIILDCPPILGLSDSLIISNYVDAAIMTISLNKVKKKLVKECLEKLNLINTPVIGTIINSVSKELNNNLLNDNYYSYSNQYSFYTYKYMPIETQNRYLNEENKKPSEKENLKDLLNNKKLPEKIRMIFNKFMIWLNE